MTERERLLTLALAMCPELERDTLRKLVDGCGGAERVWAGTPDDWRSACRIREKTVDALVRWVGREDPIRLSAHLTHQGVCWSVPGDPNFPPSLLELSVPPVILFSNHPLDMAWFHNAVSVVGTRRASAYAVEATRWVAETLAGHGYTVISGMALGVDAAAHTGALNAQGKTVAVVACGVDVCYPPQHRKLFERIRQDGIVVSEYPPGVTVTKWRFPERNRLIAALSSRLVVVQAGDRSGALLTVDWALDLGRDIFVVPGPITSTHFRGSNRLIQSGAQVVVDPVDILGISTSSASLGRPIVPQRWQALYEALDAHATAASMASLLAIPLSHIYAGLLELEVAGLVRRGNGGSYEKVQ